MGQHWPVIVRGRDGIMNDGPIWALSLAIILLAMLAYVAYTEKS